MRRGFCAVGGGLVGPAAAPGLLRQRPGAQFVKIDLNPHPAGIRAQTVLLDGGSVPGFLFKEAERMAHVVNTLPSAATSAISIG